MKKGTAVLLLLLFLSPNLFFSQKAKYLVHDNLNSNHVWYKNLAESGKILAGNYEKIERSHGGIERGFYPSEFYFIPWLYVFFPSSAAYNINLVLIHLIAFIGMFLLLRSHVFSKRHEDFVLIVALLFALLPFLPGSGITVAGQALVLWALLNILKKEYHVHNFLILFLFPFYSNFFFGNAFFVLLLLLVYIPYALHKKEINFAFIISVVGMGVVSLACEYRLISLIYLDHFVSNREESSKAVLNIFGTARVALQHFFKGHYHFHSYQFPMIPLLAIFALVISKEKIKRNGMLILLFLSGIVSILFAVFAWKYFHETFSGLLPPIQMRFQVVSPLLWYCILGFACLIIVEQKPGFKPALRGLLYFLIFWAFVPFGRTDLYGSDYAENSFHNTFIRKSNFEHQGFDQYYQTKLFTQIAQKIPKKGNIVCLGFDNEVAQYNGYNTLGAYYAIFSGEYLEKFNFILQKERAKDQSKSSVRRCVFYSYDLTSNAETIRDLRWDFAAMKALECSYVFSTKKIEVSELIEEQIFSEGEETLFIYRIALPEKDLEKQIESPRILL